MVAMLGCAASATRWHGKAIRSGFRATACALREAISEFQRAVLASGEVDPRFVRMIEQSAGLKGLKFETDPASGVREMQPVINAQGRIIGFFTWMLSDR